MTIIDPLPEAGLRKARATKLLSQFFSPPNKFVLAPRTDGLSLPNELVPAIIRFKEGNLDRPVLLPLLLPDDECVTWYVCTHDERTHHTVTAELMSFIGPSYALWDNADVTDQADRFAMRAFQGTPLQTRAFRSSAKSTNTMIARLWSDYLRLLDWQPPRPTIDLRTFAQLRAAFDRALVARNENAAHQAIAALKEHHGLTAENRVFLEIRIAAAFERWEDILKHRMLPQVLNVHLPAETYGDIWEALYEVHLRPKERTRDVRYLVEAFDLDVRTLASPLLRSKGTSKRPAALKAFLLNELSLQEPSDQLATELLDKLGPDSFGEATASVEARVRALRPRSGLEVAEAEMELERYEQAFVVLCSLQDTREVLIALLRCVKEIEDPDKAAQVMGRLNAFKEIAAITQHRPKLLAAVEALAARKICPEPEASLAASEPVQNDVLAYWREVSRSTEQGVLDQPDLVGQLVEALERHALEPDGVFDSLLPIWFEWIIGRTAPAARFSPVYQAFIEALYARDQLGDSELEMIRAATVHLLRAGPNPTQYKALIDGLTGIFVAVRSPRTFDWGLDIADALAVETCRDVAARVAWLAGIIDAAMEFRARITAAQRALLRLLADESGIQDVEALRDDMSNAPATVPVHDPAARVLIYSLDGQACQRAALTLRKLLPLSKIETNDDQICTPRLRTHARNADWVFFVASVATHQAFFCIKDAIKAGGELVHIQGTGTTRIVGSVLERVRAGMAQTNS